MAMAMAMALWRHDTQKGNSLLRSYSQCRDTPLCLSDDVVVQ
jgi:hypothetical protein